MTPAAGGWDQTNPIDGLLRRDSASFRRRAIVGTGIGVLLLAGISIALAWSQYDDAKSRAVTDLDARVVAVSALVDTSFGGQISTLQSIGKAPAVIDRQLPRMDQYFARVDPKGSRLFSGGLGWIDLHGIARASNPPNHLTTGSFADRTYFKQVVKTGLPYVSAGLIGRNNKQPVTVVAVPTFDARGHLSGVLVGSILLKTVGESKQALDLGYGDLQILDRKGNLLLEGLKPVENRTLLAQIQHDGSGALASSKGLDGHGSDVVAFATSKVSGWVTVIDRPRSTVFAASLRALTLELVSVGIGVLLVIAILLFVLRRAARDTDAQNERARSWSGLTRTLAGATSPFEVVHALLTSLAAVFPAGVAVVGFDDRGAFRVNASSRAPGTAEILEDTALLAAIAEIGKNGPVTRPLDQDPALRRLADGSGRSLRALHSVPLPGKTQPVGTISVVTDAPVLEESEWALLGSFADQAALALERSRLFMHEHELAVRLQRSLLPDQLPSEAGLELAGHYLAGGDAVEVGGDWYDAVRRADGIVQLCVGDVSGRGIGAATVMGRQRNTFHVSAYDCLSPAEIIRRIVRHIGPDEMITVACVSFDPYTGELAYACAGHPPPLLFDRELGTVVRLDGASAPPIGVAELTDIVEARLTVSKSAVLAMYTDGLIERRGQNIDDGIDLLAQIIETDGAESDPDLVVAKLSEGIGAPDDDVALLLAEIDGAMTQFEIEVAADPSSLPGIRRRLRGWLERRGLDASESADLVLAVSEACNNAIEHGYRDGNGSVKLTGECERERVRITIEDHGSWREESPSDERGRGLLLMRQLMDSVEVDAGAAGTRVTLEHLMSHTQQTVAEPAPVAPRS